jgi:hypothetical protein
MSVVMATDIVDKDLKLLRQLQWDKVFNEESMDFGRRILDDCDRRATICIEHLIQASDDIHTMQHWHIYQKWNRRLFHEMSFVYKHGRLANEPCLSWYDGELWFFDNYIIPLAKKLKICGVIGANSEAFLDFARDNRTEWEAKGRLIVEDWTYEVSKDVITKCLVPYKSSLERKVFWI